jgi:signal peptidase I
MRWVRRVASAVLLVTSLGIVGAGALLWHDGYRVYAVRTGSMSPSYPVGSIVVDTPPSADGAAVGSVITFRASGGLVTHRVFETSEDGLTTKGDANNTPDAWTIPPESVVGQVIASVPKLGYLLVFFKQPSGVLSVVAGLGTMILLWQLFFPDDDDEEDEPAPHEPELAALTV